MTVDCGFFLDFNLAIYLFGGLFIVKNNLTLVLGLGWTRIQHSMKICLVRRLEKTDVSWFTTSKKILKLDETTL